ncbi:MAG: transcription-repair coupling factor [Nitrospinota bacterium]
MNEALLSFISRPEGKRRVRLRGGDEASRAWWLARLLPKLSAPLIYVEADPRRLAQVEQNLRVFLGEAAGGEGRFRVFAFPAWDVYPYARLSPSSEVVGARMGALDFLLGGGGGLVLTTPEAIAGRLPSLGRLRERTRTLREGEEIDREGFLGSLEGLMYQRRSVVESPGEYAVRGGIVDFFPPQEPCPIRMDLKGDEVDSLREFNPQTQRTLRSRREVRVFPARELLLSAAERGRGAEALRRAAGGDPGLAGRVERMLRLLEVEGHFPGAEGLSPFFVDPMATFFDAVPGDALWMLHDADALAAAEKKLWAELAEEAALADERGLIGFPPERLWMRPGEVAEALSLWPRLELDPLGLDDAGEEGGAPPALTAERLSPIRGRLDAFMDQLTAWRRAGAEVLLAAEERTQALRFQALLREREVEVPLLAPGACLLEEGAGVAIVEGRLTSSFHLPGERRVFFRSEDLLVTSLGRLRRRAGRGRPGEGLRDLRANDFLVHVAHGVGRYLGTQIIEHAEGEDEFLTLAYAGGDRLYVPMDDVDKVHIYRGSGEAPALERLDGSRWDKAKKGVKKALQAIARDLVRLYAERGAAVGFAFAQDGAWDREMTAGFQYEETPDQDQAIRDVLADMERPRPMDRLICGDVGYGKTEVALRAAARAVSCGKQVALVVPTTLLAHQHLDTFRERFAALPVEVEMLSRFRSRKDQAEVARSLAKGEVDIVIGTHRLLQEDVSFKDLGLLIVDEEHRFGVSHKEKLKKLKVDVDVLSMTATPIPRTLQLALSGTRDLSIIETPPRHRLAPRTYIARFGAKVVGDAIRRELDRGGQVFFVHNRVGSLPAMARFLQKVAPGARILAGHGQMRERELEQVMEDFVSRKADILLSTTIIESGLDIPTVNTIFINRADTLGMAQLYQLRGRVGRDRYQAHAYLLVPGAEAMTQKARERLQALEELSELGGGFKLAMRDLEIRGSGHLLGHRQSGHIAAVGFEMYCRLLEEVIQESKGRTVERREPDLSFPVAGSIPPVWVPAQAERLEVYRRVAAAASPREIREMERELADRFGPLPSRAQRLLQLAELRVRARRCGVRSLHVKGREAHFEIFPGDYELSAAFLESPGMSFTGTHSFRCALTGPWEEDFARLVRLLEAFEACIPEEEAQTIAVPAGDEEEEGEA